MIGQVFASRPEATHLIMYVVVKDSFGIGEWVKIEILTLLLEVFQPFDPSFLLSPASSDLVHKSVDLKAFIDYGVFLVRLSP